MRLDFNVLWIEDHPGSVSDLKQSISDKIREQGFRLNVKSATSIEQAIKEYLDKDVYRYHIDLVLMDYDLGENKTNGAEGINKVREKIPYRDIIFYSSARTTELETELEKESKKIIDVFTCYRPDLEQQFDEVFERLIKKVLDINHERGIIVGATCDIDERVFNTVCEIYEQRSDKEKNNILGKINKTLKKKKKNMKIYNILKN